MRFPKHMILNFEVKNSTSQHWTTKAIRNVKNLPVFITDLNFNHKYAILQRSSTHKLKNNMQTVNYNTGVTITSSFLQKKTKKILTKKKTSTLEMRHLLLKVLFFNTKNKDNLKLNTWYSNINLNFLRKERLYTKLKYSRSPAYDIVSGGAAAIFAGFIGFLISEKFGFELADSGDFYYLFMYLVFIAFLFRPIVTSINLDNGLYGIFKIKEIKVFYINILSLILWQIKLIFKK